jgi:hypothetical protein
MTDGSQRPAFASVLGRVEAALSERGGPYFLGEQFSLVDCIFAPFLERMAASLLYYKGFDMRNNPQYRALERWFRAMEQRPTFRNIKSDYWTHAMVGAPESPALSPGTMYPTCTPRLDSAHLGPHARACVCVCVCVRAGAPPAGWPLLLDA